ncbi:response regulator [Methylophaga sp.]|uniref:response regulator n=1 Tax=Methylophaga sp. TaxID=2024840 RepID=UPI003F6982D6
MQVDCCQHAAEAQVKVQSNSYDLLICDLNMPDCPGDELLRYALDNSANERLALAAMTALSQDDVSRFYCVPENTTVICKPVDRSGLFSLILAVNAAKCLTRME